MNTLKIKWEAKGKGVLEIPLEDLDLTLEEWNNLSQEAQEDVARDMVYQDDETLVYGELKSFKIVDGD